MQSSAAETSIVPGVNCWKVRSIYYLIAISSTVGCLRATLVQFSSKTTCYEARCILIYRLLLIFVPTFSCCTILIVSLCAFQYQWLIPRRWKKKKKSG
ncbi:unnamed protein product [Cochlearia groenlandica]